MGRNEPIRVFRYVHLKFTHVFDLCLYLTIRDALFDYIGMSVTGGYFLGDNISVFAAGAPRGNETGQVVLFVKKPSTGPDDKWKRYLIINGEQIASNFGYQLTAADLNGDK